MAGIAVTGEAKEMRLSRGAIRYREVGEGPALVFVHGVLANGTPWREVVPRLSGDSRCIVPDLPLGGHTVPMDQDAELTPLGVAPMVADLVEALELRDLTLVGSDTGGAICQILVAEHSERVGSLVLTNCDAYDAFFLPLLSPFQCAARVFGTRFVDLLALVLRARVARRALPKVVALRRMNVATLDAYVGSLLQDAAVRRDLAGFLGSVSNRYTLEAARRFSEFRPPVLIVWGGDDPSSHCASLVGCRETSPTRGSSWWKGRAHSSPRTGQSAWRSSSPVFWESGPTRVHGAGLRSRGPYGAGGFLGV